MLPGMVQVVNAFGLGRVLVSATANLGPAFCTSDQTPETPLVLALTTK
jgi:hypothetical protein